MQAAAELLRRRAIRGSLYEWCVHALKALSQEPARHHRLLIEKLEAVSRGDIDRLMVMMPPGSAKSTYVSVLFPGWFFANHPNCNIIGASHTQELAEDFSARVQSYIRENERELSLNLTNDNRGLWGVPNGSRYRAAGVGGAVTGSRADLAIIDDPVKSRASAESERERATTWDWFRSDLLTRLKPGGRIVVVMTRWHEDDVGGRLLANEPNRWHVLKLPALAELDDPLGREPGEPLWPEWEPLEALADKRKTLGERDWASLFQQDPRPMEGGIFKTANLQTIDSAPTSHHVVRAWDLAATSKTGTSDPDYTCGVKMCRTDDDRFCVLDVVRFRGNPEDVERNILATAAADGRNVRIGPPQDPGQAGKSQVAYFTRKLAGFRVESTVESGDKSTRAMPYASQVNVGNVSLVRSSWADSYRDELRGFPGMKHDDQVDASSRAFSMLVQPFGPTRTMRINWMGR